MKTPARPFVLYLRSFAAEQTYYAGTQFIQTNNTVPVHKHHSGFLVKRAVEQLSKFMLVVEALNLGEYGGSYTIEGVTRVSLYEFDNWQEHIERLAEAARVIVLHYDDATAGLGFELSVASERRAKTVVFCPDHLVAAFEHQLSGLEHGPAHDDFANFLTYEHRVITTSVAADDALPIRVGRKAREPAISHAVGREPVSTGSGWWIGGRP